MSFVALIVVFYISLKNLKLNFKVGKDKFFFIKSSFLYAFLILTFANISFHINKNTLGINYELTFAKNAIAGIQNPLNIYML